MTLKMKLKNLKPYWSDSMAKKKCIYRRIIRRLQMIKQMDGQEHDKTGDFIDQTIEIIRKAGG